MNEMKTRGILVVSYGSSYREERENSIGSIEQAIQNAFPEYKVYRAFTCESIIERIKKKEGVRVDTIAEALERAASDGIKEITILQTHLVKGVRYEAMTKAVETYSNSFEQIIVVDPVLSKNTNIDVLAKVLEMLGSPYDDGKTAVCYVGHGIEESLGIVFGQLQDVLKSRGRNNYYIGTLSIKPTLEDVKQCVKAKGIYERVVLIPLMLVSGYHVRKDMMGPKSDSWKNVFLAEGYEVECVKCGLGEHPLIQKIFVEHIKSAIL